MDLCKSPKKDGSPCETPARPGSEYCFSHDPALAAKRAAGRRAGGYARHGRKIGTTGQPTITGDAPSVQDVCIVLWDELKMVSSKEESMSRARTVAYLAEKLLKALEVGELAERLEALERLMEPE